MVKQRKMKDYELKIVNKRKVREILSRYGYSKAINGDIFSKSIFVDYGNFATQTFCFNDDVLHFSVEYEASDEALEVPCEMAVVYEMLSRKAVEVRCFDKEQPFLKLLNEEVLVQRTYLKGEFYAYVVAIPNDEVGKRRNMFLVEYRGLKRPNEAKTYSTVTRDYYTYTYGDINEIFPKEWVSFNEIKEIKKWIKLI